MAWSYLSFRLFRNLVQSNLFRSQVLVVSVSSTQLFDLVSNYLKQQTSHKIVDLKLPDQKQNTLDICLCTLIRCQFSVEKCQHYSRYLIKHYGREH
jgi:hypothetical protein